MEHVTAYVIEIGAFNTLGTAHHNIIGGVNTVAAGTMGTEQIIPPIAIHQVGGFAVDGDILFLITLYTKACLGIKFYQTDGAEIGTVTYPQTPRRRIEE